MAMTSEAGVPATPAGGLALPAEVPGALPPGSKVPLAFADAEGAKRWTKSLLITAVCASMLSVGEWIGTRHERHL